jgi:hypothetical protein
LHDKEIQGRDRVFRFLSQRADGEVRKKVGLLNRRIAKFSAINPEGEIEPVKVQAYAQKTSDLREVITLLNKIIDERKATQRHAIKMIVYRAETAMAQIVRQEDEPP